MDYARIYSVFISNRQAMGPPEGYSERHHIVPRSLGGTDDDGNLIDLRPEDHFFAHLLLAKIHGGSLWAPVVMWLGGARRNWAGRRSRLQYGWASRAASLAASGAAAHQFDHRVHELEHKDGERFSGTQAAIADRLGLDRSGVCMLIGGTLASFKGWFLAGKRPQFIGRGSRKGTHHPMARPEVLRFRHVDGRSFAGTQHELHTTHGVSKPSACRLARGLQTIAGGWYLEGREPTRLGRAGSYFKAAAPAE